MAEGNRRPEALTLAIVSHRHKFIFVHARKSAGTSLQVSLSRWLGEGDVASYDVDSPVLTFNRYTDEDDFGAVPVRDGDESGVRYGNHDLPDEIRGKVGEDVWAAYFKFTVARNPWDLLVSYLHSKFGPHYWRDVWGRRRPIAFVRNVPRALRLFRLRRELARGRRKEAVESVLREGLFGDVGQIPRFYFSRGEAYADYVIRFENLQQGYDEVCRRLGLPPQSLPRANTRPRPKGIDYRDYYTDFSREYVADLCRPMTAAFGYRFDDGAGRHRAHGR